MELLSLDAYGFAAERLDEMRPDGRRLAQNCRATQMKRVGGLWPDIVSFSNLLRAAEKAAAGKRTRTDVAALLMNLEVELLQLRRELTQGSYIPGPYRSFRNSGSQTPPDLGGSRFATAWIASRADPSGGTDF